MIPYPTALFGDTFSDSWRPGQDLAIRRAVECNKRWFVGALPVGVGKSHVGMGIARMTGARTIILTSTRGLQDQYRKEFANADFGKPLLFDLRGMGNYRCALLLDRGAGDSRCDVGPCLDGDTCVYKAGGCEYFDALEDAGRAQIVVTNYAKYYAMVESGQIGALGPRDLLICDEAHDAAEGLGRYAGCSFRPSDVRLPLDADTRTLEGWRAWADDQLARADGIDLKTLGPRERKSLRGVMRRLERLASCPDTWIADYRHGDGWAFEPVWAADYTDTWLWRDIPKVVLLSATLRPKAAEVALGLKEGDYEFFEAPSPFAASRHPITHVKTTRVHHRMSDAARAEWIGRVDQIIRTRLGVKIVVHTVSYERARDLVVGSGFSQHMLLPSGAGDTRRVVETFRRASAPAILISPSVHTGYSFADDDARCQIIVKVPYPDTRKGLAAARQALDPTYAARTAIVTLEQMCGRIMRGPDDWGESVIVDDSIRPLYRQYPGYFSAWWRKAYRSVETVPAPMEL